MAGYYVHIPFCIQKCSYCDFVSYQGKQGYMQDYTAAVLKEIASYPPIEVDTVFFGGGTPSTLPADQLIDILKAIKFHNDVKENAEISIEMNPESINENLAKSLLKAGFNRFSIGLQSADDQILKVIGRAHDYERFVAGYNLLRRAGAANINIDLMYGLPNQTEKIFQETINKVLSLKPQHISAYELIINDDTQMGDMVNKGKLKLPDEDEVFRQSEILKSLEKKYERYEISNYCLPNYECKHNLNYWNNGFYVGVGAAAHGCIQQDGKIIRYSNKSDLCEYIKIPLEKETSEEIDKEEQIYETIMLGLRKTEGIKTEDFYKRFNLKLETLIGEYIKQNPNLIVFQEGRILLTKRGLDLQNTVLVELMSCIK